MMRIVSGGQTGVDQAAWRAAIQCGLATGGWMPKGFQTEEGPRPDLAELGARELASDRYEVRTTANVLEADATLILTTEAESPGTSLTVRTCVERGKPCLFARLDDPAEFSPRQVARWIIENCPSVLNVAGPRESTAPGIGAKVEAFLLKVFRAWKKWQGRQSK